MNNDPILTEISDRRADDRTRFYGGVAEAVIASAPVGSTFYAVGFDNVDALLRAGYRGVEAPLDADVVIACGGEREFCAARQAASDGQKLVLFPTHAFFAAASEYYRAADGAFATVKHGAKPYAAAFDRNAVDLNHASIFGEIAALDLCAFELVFSARMRGEKPPVETAREVSELVSKLTATLKNNEKDRAATAELLVDAGKQAALLVADNPALLHGSGAAQMSEAVRMLYAAEERPLGMRGETEMLLCSFVIDFYIKNSGGAPLEFPPDNNKRMDRLCEYLGADLPRACLYTSPVYPPLKMRLCEYRLGEFRAELLSLLSALKTRQAAAFRVFKRLYPDDGYGIKTMIDRADLGICLALAPDAFAADTMLSYLKQTGILEKYIV